MPTPARSRSPMQDGQVIEQSVLGGLAKLQWKVDWAMRWVALGVDYEMAGKDLIDSVIQSSKIARVLGGKPPEGFNYEMFLDEKGEKISKSKGNGLSLEQWLTYGPQESLAFYIYREPKKAKQLHIGVIPRAVDDYWQFRGNYAGAGMAAAARQSGAPRPRRQAARRRIAGDVRVAAQSGRRARRCQQGTGLGLSRQLRPRRQCRNGIRSSTG